MTPAFSRFQRLSLFLPVFVLRRLLSPPQPKATKSGSAKKPAAAPYSKGKATKAPKNPLFEKRPRNFGIGK